MIENVKKEIFEKLSGPDKVLIIILIIGIGFVGVGLFKGIVEDSQVQVEIIKDNSGNSSGQKIVVDVSGAVVVPGVYELSIDSRIKDALVTAGGLSVEADRDYVQKNVNLAEIIKDGQKIFIPKIGINGSVVGYAEAKNADNKINVNLATTQELDTLTGIGSTRAINIINGRPYKNVEELVTKGVLTKSILDKIKDKIVAY